MLLYYDRIDVSEGIDINKTSESKVFFNYWYFDIKALSFNQMSAMDAMIY